MIHFDTSFLADYLQGETYTIDFLEAHEDEPYSTTSVVRFELFNGALKHPSPKMTVEGVRLGLQWVSVEPFDDGMAEEAAEIQEALRERGAILSAFDALIAGAAREVGATLVTRDDDFERVDGLTVSVLG
ncbi:PIN domain-containing protein [Halococcus hamelinensis]|uniref:Ribonuclease VapC n=1 Tax=Halococcus hamelinensis 100A6 TaxID=1132509 RepID=M0M7T9_9EURY|nr:PIN domain-containing protein [Halococcus hamelinensis]EMA40679.1 twitching mobility protein PilT [Halococcus hamelinensis 100A6]